MAEYARLLRGRKLRAATLIDECEAHYQRYEPKFNAYKTWNGNGARAHAEAADLLFDRRVDLGPLMGLPVSVKDLYGVPGMPVFAGSDTELPETYRQAGPVVKEVLRQFGSVVGKTHTVEFAFGGLGVNAHWGTPFNPWASNGARVPGGSSSGAGVSLVQGTALLALGTDTAGSVRIPASLTGQVGLKTTQGRWPIDGIVPLSSSLDTPGLLCRTVEDLVYSFSAIDSGLHTHCSAEIKIEQLSGLRIGIPDNFFWDGADPSVVACVESAISNLARAGANVTRLTVPHCEQVYEIFCKGGLAAPELAAYMQMNFPEKIARLDAVVRARVEGADQVSSVEYLRRKAMLKFCGEQAISLFADVDVLITPTVAISPPLLAEIGNAADYGKANLLTLRNTSIANLFGWCALSMPVGLDAHRMPVGMQLIAPPMQEARLLGIAAIIEKHLGNQFQLLGSAPHLR
jgi:aspartyl-tRNA(Asn)/glutamyl-tRNA(Gln) amidotransferase subunit A